MIEKKKLTLVNFCELKVPKIRDNISEIMLSTTKFCDFGFKSSEVGTYNVKEEPTVFTGLCHNIECKIIECLLMNLPSLQEEFFNNDQLQELSRSRCCIDARSTRGSRYIYNGVHLRMAEFRFGARKFDFEISCTCKMRNESR